MVLALLVAVACCALSLLLAEGHTYGPATVCFWLTVLALVVAGVAGHRIHQRVPPASRSRPPYERD